MSHVERDSRLTRETQALASRIRESCLLVAHRSGGAHIASCLSCADILAVLYGAVLRVNASDPLMPGRDRFVMSKGHAAMALYAVLAEQGFFPASELASYGEPGNRLCGHVHAAVPGVEASTGSLGHGLNIACGMALAGKADRAKWRVYALLSDGECQEGSVWEAAMFAAHHRLGNLTTIIDRNGFQACGTTESVMALEPLEAKWKAFGWDVRGVDGHDHRQLREAIEARSSQPLVIIALTTKGRGVPFMENGVDWHYRAPDQDELTRALKAVHDATRCH